MPDDIQAAAQSLLGYRDNRYCCLAISLKPDSSNFSPPTSCRKRPRIICLARSSPARVIAENQDGQWTEIFRCDEHLKNAKGYLGLTPLSSVTGWRIQYEQDPVKGLQLYFTPLKGTDDDAHVLPIGVRWNPKTKRYQSLDRNYESFLLESPT